MKTELSILLFGGTTEGRMLTERLLAHSISVTVCVATDYGEMLLPDSKKLTICKKRLNQKEMETLIQHNSFTLAVDATHPFALLVSDCLSAACQNCGLPYYRIVREPTALHTAPVSTPAVPSFLRIVPSINEAVSMLPEIPGNILVTTGSKDLANFIRLPDYKERLFVRVLPSSDAISACEALGFSGKHLIAMQGPFSKQLNTALIQQFAISCLITKESGIAGGFPEKLSAAKATGICCIVIKRPPETDGYTPDQFLALFFSKYDCYTGDHASF